MNNSDRLLRVELDASPFVGIRSFNESERMFFCGRDQEIEVIAANVNVSPLTILYGPSGAGKSSVLRAGVLPYLREQRGRAVVYFNDWLDDDFTVKLEESVHAAVKATAHPVPASVASPVAGFDWTSGPWAAQVTRSDASVVRTITDATQTIKGPLILMLDQFEDYLLRTAPVNDDDCFDAWIATIINRRDIEANVLIGIREDYLAKVDRLRARISGLLANTLRLDPLTKRQAEAAVRGPVDIYNQAVEAQGRARELTVAFHPDDNPVDAVVEGCWDGTACQPAALQIAMERLWTVETVRWQQQGRRDSRLLRREVLGRDLGGVAGVLRVYLAQPMATLNENDHPIVDAIFTQAATPSGERRQFKREDVQFRDDGAAVSRVVDLLVNKQVLRLLPPDRYELFHHVLTPAALEWRRHFEAKEMARRQRETAEHEREEAVRLEREIAKREQVRIKYVASAVGLAICAILAAVAVWQWFEASASSVRANESSARANSTLFALRADNALADTARGPEVAITLARHARSFWDTEEARTSLYQAVEASTVALMLCAHDGRAMSVAYSAAPPYKIATAGVDGTVKVWDTSGRPLLRIDRLTPRGHTAGVNIVAFSRQGDLVTASDDGTVKIWDVQGTQPRHLQTIDAQSEGREEIWAAALSPSGELLATAGERGVVRLWDIRGPTPVRTAQLTHKLSVISLAFDATGTRLASAGMDKLVKIWNVPNGTLVASLEGHQDFVYGVAFGPEVPATEVASSSWDGTVRIWDLRTNSARVLQSPSPALWSVTYSPNGKLLAAAGRDGRVTLWDRQALDKELLILPSSAPGLTGLTFSPNSSQIAAASMTGFVRIWNLPSVRLLTNAVSRHAMSAAAFSPDGRLVLVVANDGAVVFETKTGAQQRALPFAEGAPSLLTGAFAPDGGGIATGGLDGSLTLSTPDGRSTRYVGPAGAISSIAFDVRSRRMAAASWDKSVWVWDPAQRSDGQAIVKFAIGRALAVAFSPDGQAVAAGAEAREGTERQGMEYVRIHRLADGAEVGLRPPSGAGDVTRIAYSPDGTYLVVGFNTGLLAIWEIGGAGEAGSRPSANLLAPGHQSRVTDLQFRADGTLASTSADGITKVWDTRTRSVQFAMHGHTGGVYGLSFTVEPGQLTTVGQDGVINHHLLEWSTVARKAEQQGRLLTEIECQDYFGQRDCRPFFQFPVASGCSGG